MAIQMEYDDLDDTSEVSEKKDASPLADYLIEQYKLRCKLNKDLTLET